MKQLCSFGVLVLALLSPHHTWAQWKPDEATNTPEPSPFLLPEAGEQVSGPEVVTEQAANQVSSSFALPEEPSGVAAGDTIAPTSESAFALPLQSTGVEKRKPASGVEDGAEASGPSSPFALPVDTNVTGIVPDEKQFVIDTPQADSSFSLPEQDNSTVVDDRPAVEGAMPQVQLDETADLSQDLSAEVLREKGTELARAGNYDEARQMLALSLQKDPENVLTLNNLGFVMRKLGRVEEAMQAYVFAIQLDEQYALTYKNLGILLEHQGENETAVEAYRQYVQLAPGAADAADVIARADWLQQQ